MRSDWLEYSANISLRKMRNHFKIKANQYSVKMLQRIHRSFYFVKYFFYIFVDFEDDLLVELVEKSLFAVLLSDNAKIG